MKSLSDATVIPLVSIETVTGDPGLPPGVKQVSSDDRAKQDGGDGTLLSGGQGQAVSKTDSDLVPPLPVTSGK